MCPTHTLKWIKDNTDNKFNKLFSESTRNSLIFNNYEDKLIKIHDLIKNSKFFDNSEFGRSMIVHAKKNKFLKAIKNFDENVVRCYILLALIL